MEWSSSASPVSSRTSAPTMPPSDSLTISPGTSSVAGMLVQTPSRRTVAFSASLAFKASKVACARLSCTKPRTALNTSSTPITAASGYSPIASCSTMAASSIHGTGAQNFPTASRQAGGVVSAMALGPISASLRRASRVVSPLERAVDINENPSNVAQWCVCPSGWSIEPVSMLRGAPSVGGMLPAKTIGLSKAGRRAIGFSE